MTAPDLGDDLTAFLANQRWFAGKGRPFEVVDVRQLAVLEGDVRVLLVDVRYDDDAGDPTETYQVPVVRYDQPEDRLSHALVQASDEGHVYDALHDRQAMDAYLQLFARGGGVVDDVEFHRVPGHDLDTTTHSTLFSGEQSNSSVAFGEDSMLKVFRKVTPGANPDIEVHRALTEAGNEHVAKLYGWVTGVGAQGAKDLAMLQQFLRTATDGWELALASVRNLFAEQDLHAGEVGGDFAGEAHRLGVAVVEVHADLVDAFGSGTLDPAMLADTLDGRLDGLLAVVPELEEHESGLRRLYDRVRSLGALPIQRVHGDLHLGQTLRTSLGWKLVDFEGEPARPLADRRLPDSPWRDVAGMLRSFDYAAHVVLRDMAPEGDLESTLDYRAHEWSARNATAFLDGYAPDGVDEVARTLLWAYEADKAVYECGYEARNRPAWLAIPLRAVARLAKEADQA